MRSNKLQSLAVSIDQPWVLCLQHQAIMRRISARYSCIVLSSFINMWFMNYKPFYIYVVAVCIEGGSKMPHLPKCDLSTSS